MNVVAAVLTHAGIGWVEFKQFLESSTAVSQDSLHVVLGVALQILAAAIYRSSLSSIWPWLTVAMLELANEWNDIRIDRWPNSSMQFGESAKDILLTLFLPTILWVIARRYPRVLRGSS